MSKGQASIPLESIGEVFAQELSSRSIEVPLLPNIATEVLSSSLDDQSDASRLADLIQQDQGLASHILRVVNSPAFRGSAEIVALQQAIARIGMERIREIALTVSLKGTLFKPTPFDSIVTNAWQHGLRSGLWAKEVARAAVKNVEMAYLCGLLHNVGVAIAVHRLWQLNKDISDQELATLVDTFADDVGLLLVEEWRLPAVVGLTLRFQKDFQSAKNAIDSVAVSVVGAYFSQAQVNGELNVEHVLPHAAVQHLNFYPDDIEKLLQHAERIELTVEGMA